MALKKERKKEHIANTNSLWCICCCLALLGENSKNKDASVLTQLHRMQCCLKHLLIEVIH